MSLLDGLSRPLAMSTIPSSASTKRKLGTSKARRNCPRRPKRRHLTFQATSEDVIDVEDLALIDLPTAREALLEWYDKHQRRLPWRRSPDDPRGTASQSHAYAVWVSEVMLQQTQVVKVVDYFRRWMLRWPDVRSLAEADLDDVREVWAGLGYYSRAANLWKGAKYLMQGFDGCLPDSIDALKRIPGVGEYTSRAIASIAFGKPEAVVDGNVVRVLARLFAVRSDPKQHRQKFQSLADGMVDRGRPGDFNQAMMELGAIVTDYPVIGKRPAKKEKTVAVCILQLVTDQDVEDRMTLMIKRPMHGLLAGLWEFPTIEIPAKDIDGRASLTDAYLRRISDMEIAEERVLERTRLGMAVHIFTHIRMTLSVELLVMHGQPDEMTFSDEVEIKWLSEQELKAAGLCSMVKKVYRILNEHRQA